ncbi:MAG: hypothetical protein QXL01_00095 [Thermoplasmatales archaeon]
MKRNKAMNKLNETTDIPWIRIRQMSMIEIENELSVSSNERLKIMNELNNLSDIPWKTIRQMTSSELQEKVSFFSNKMEHFHPESIEDALLIKEFCSAMDEYFINFLDKYPDIKAKVQALKATQKPS